MNESMLGISGLGNMGTTHLRVVPQGMMPGVNISALGDSNAKPLPEDASLTRFTDRRSRRRSRQVHSLARRRV